MSESFRDTRIAAEMRDIIKRTVVKVIQQMNLEPAVGTVTSVNSTTKTAVVIMPGDTTGLTVAYGKGITPVSGDIVRFQGKPGAYYILNFVSS